MTKKETIRYLNNDDISTISYKNFAESSQDTYPTFSVCFFDDGNGSMFRHFSKALAFSIPISGAEATFVRLLKGQKVVDGQSNKDDFDVRNISEYYFDAFTIKLESIYYGIQFLTENHNDSLSIYRFNDSRTPLPFFLSYLDPGRICYTRNNDQKQNSSRIEDNVSFFYYKYRRVYLQRAIYNKDIGLYMLDQYLKMKIYIHHPGQLLRVFDSPVFESKIMDLDTERRLLSFKISQVSILRKRPDSNIPCNPDLYDDDLQQRIQVAEDVGCIPVYWKKIMQGSLTLKTCKTQEEMEKIWSRLQNLNEIQLSYDPPCNQMKLAVTVVGQPTTHKRIPLFEYSFKYMEKTYEEIVNEREFGINSLWSSVGGFVGIFVGTSLSQLPTLIAAACSWIQKILKTNMAKKDGKIRIPRNQRIIKLK